MKPWIPTFALLISSLFAPVAVSAQPNICNGPSGLVYVPTFTCQAANVGVFSGLTVGNCLVIEADLSIGTGTCGGGGGGSNFPTGITTGVPGTDGPFAVVQNVNDGVIFSTSTTTCIADPLGSFNTCGGALLITDPFGGGPIFYFDEGGNFATAVGAQIHAGAIDSDTPYTTLNQAQTIPGRVPTIFRATLPSSGYYHCIEAGSVGLTASAGSTSVTITTQPFVGHYSLTINDDTVLATVPPVTSKTTTGFTFTSVNAHIYSYLACGE